MVFIPVHAEQKPYFFSNIDQCLKKIPSKLTPKQKKIRTKIKKSDLRLNYNPKIHFQDKRKTEKKMIEEFRSRVNSRKWN